VFHYANSDDRNFVFGYVKSFKVYESVSDRLRRPQTSRCDIDSTTTTPLAVHALAEGCGIFSSSPFAGVVRAVMGRENPSCGFSRDYAALIRLRNERQSSSSSAASAAAAAALSAAPHQL